MRNKQIICIDASSDLTFDRSYTIENETEMTYLIRDDTGRLYFYDKKRFELLYVVRRRTLNELLK
jgi:hypothetical protein